MSDNKTSLFHLVAPLAMTEKKDTPTPSVDHENLENVEVKKEIMSEPPAIPVNKSNRSYQIPTYEERNEKDISTDLGEVDIDDALMKTFSSTNQALPVEEMAKEVAEHTHYTPDNNVLEELETQLQPIEPIETSAEAPLYEVPPAIDFDNYEELSPEDVDEAYRKMMEAGSNTDLKETAAAQVDSSPILFDDGDSLDGEQDTINILAPVSKSTGEAEAKRPQSLLPLFRQLQDRDSTFVFLFGRQQAGKTVILSSLAHHMGVDENGVLETRRRTDNLKGAAYLKQLYKSVREGRFMNRTAVGSLYELDLKYTPHQPATPMHFTFLEMSGEDLSKVELSETSAGQLPSNIDIYLRCPNLNLLFMVVVPYEDASDHDYLVIDFLDYLAERKPGFDFSKVLLLISKWDRYEGMRRDEVDVFVKEQMPRTYSRLKANKGTIARYSIGEATEDNQFIVNLNKERPETIKRWLYYTITGKRIKDETQSIWNKMKSWF